MQIQAVAIVLLCAWKLVRRCLRYHKRLLTVNMMPLVVEQGVLVMYCPLVVCYALFQQGARFAANG